jgi:hypothetical protein
MLPGISCQSAMPASTYSLHDRRLYQGRGFLTKKKGRVAEASPPYHQGASTKHSMPPKGWGVSPPIHVFFTKKVS